MLPPIAGLPLLLRAKREKQGKTPFKHDALLLLGGGMVVYPCCLSISCIKTWQRLLASLACRIRILPCSQSVCETRTTCRL